ncbi:class I SAM-dependent methyltransferase [Sulfitobacter donghicola]|uniref:Methylase n=1 Tax=Sulfitobacter donghicola DSW-25 = KCTC 12864 = JCM 14565 TaxID=1300350 RepID=A0A073IED7_9RHOB|nr:class I SAM-dependent methyltransferase [Sulfitobacter donghicola]KEJ88079.1 methylase [Sulfitobacter donghicola DSW-25 = KCTC 12864 = JCM 14565]KIN68702.1 Type 11 family methyltransferase [Sulfitobacter donghicola DSW-25 = KCTC 12864 = JCM 14565]
MSETRRVTDLNRLAWDASAPLHGTGAAWETLCDTIQSGGSTLDETLTGALVAAGIKGARIVQVGCNNGREVFSTLALGAKEGWGIDQSKGFLDQAAHLNTLSPHHAHFLRADIYALPADAPKDFDIALITIGVLNWMPDLPRFFEVIAGLLRQGGQLIIYETHPMLEMFDPAADAPLAPAFSYFQTDAHIETQSITYDGTSTEGGPEAHWFPHTLSKVVQSALDAGLTLKNLHEYPHSIREVDYDVYVDQPAQIPMSFLLRASKN